MVEHHHTVPSAAHSSRFSTSQHLSLQTVRVSTVPSCQLGPGSELIACLRGKALISQSSVEVMVSLLFSLPQEYEEKKKS